MRCLGPVLIAIVLPVVGFSGCRQPGGEPESRALAGPYLGQSAPGAVPQLFGGGLVAAPFDTRDTAWTPDGDELYYTVWSRGRGTIVVVGQAGDGWDAPEIAPFSGQYSDLEAFITSNGDELFFASKRPLEPGSEEKNWDLWVVRRSDTGWAEPESLGPPINTDGDEFYPSLTSDGTLYFTAEREDSLGGEDIYRSSRLTDGGWAEPENLGPAVNSPGPEFNALVAPDESFLIFGSVREGDVGGGDLHVTFRNPDGSWRPAKKMGPVVNSPALDFCPALSPDGDFLFFTSRRVPADKPDPISYLDLKESLRDPLNGSANLWWVDASVIDQFRRE